MRHYTGYSVDETTGCWLWQGAITNNYGLKKYEGRMIRAHRYYYIQAKGQIPEGMHLHHMCRNKLCVNPDHLQPLTPAENCRHRPTTKLNPDKVREARRLYAERKESIRSMARRFGVSHGVLERAIHGVSWRDV